MVESVEAVLAVLVGLLPGALGLWSFERHAGAWGIALPDRFLRFLGISATFHALAAPLTYWIWLTYAQSGDWQRDAFLAWPLWLTALAYVGVPIGVGSLVGRATRAKRRWVRLLGAPADAPRAWDSFFFPRPDGWIRLKMKSGTWLGGAFVEDSWASHYPEPGDLYLTRAAELETRTGAFVFGDRGEVVTKDSGILVRWEEVEYLEFIDG